MSVDCEIVLILYPLWVQSWFPYFSFLLVSTNWEMYNVRSWHIYSVLTIVSWTITIYDWSSRAGVGVICEVNLEGNVENAAHCHAPGHAPWPSYQSRSYLPTYIIPANSLSNALLWIASIRLQSLKIIQKYIEVYQFICFNLRNK